MATGAIVGLLTFPLFIAGIALIGTAIERVEGAADVASWRLLGGLLLILGLFVTMPLAFLSTVTAVRPRAEQMAPTWIEFLALAAAWSLCPGLDSPAPWLRRRPTWQTIRFLWLTLSATFPAIAALSYAMRPFLPRSL